jgi:hypothetical protein
MTLKGPGSRGQAHARRRKKVYIEKEERNLEDKHH